MAVECKFEQVFDSKDKLQYVNGEVSVLHCHHYSTLFTKLALDSKILDGPKNLIEAMEDSAFLSLKKYFLVEKVTAVDDRRSISEQYFALIGLGELSLDANNSGGKASMAHSHVDEGWITKWGRRSKPVNLIGQGFLAGAFSAIFDCNVGSYSVREISSIVSGGKTSEFIIKRK